MTLLRTLPRSLKAAFLLLAFAAVVAGLNLLWPEAWLWGALLALVWFILVLPSSLQGPLDRSERLGPSANASFAVPCSADGGAPSGDCGGGA